MVPRQYLYMPLLRRVRKIRKSLRTIQANGQVTMKRAKQQSNSPFERRLEAATHRSYAALPRTTMATEEDS